VTPGAPYRCVEVEGQAPVARLRRLPERPWDDVVIVRPRLVGLCRSDLKELQGTRRERRDFGHEIVGTVEWAPERVARGRGDWVSFNPNAAIERGSGFGEWLVARGEAAELQRAFPLVPGQLPLRKLVACEPLACAAHCALALRSRIGACALRGARVAVLGAGNAGTLIAMVLRALGAEITLLNRGRSRLALLAERGIFAAEQLVPLTEARAGAYDAVVPATSFLDEHVLRASLALLRRGGLALLYGGTTAGTTLPGRGLRLDALRRHEAVAGISWEGKPVTIAGSYGAAADDFALVARLLAEAPESFPVERLITREVGLEELPELLVRLARDEQGYAGKVVVVLP
jgi:threonine dehydrogenase-like Zn-dependent dehydrogenase